MKKILQISLLALAAVKLQAKQSSHGADIDNAISAIHSSLEALKELRQKQISIVVHKDTADDLVASPAFPGLNNSIKQPVTAYHKSATTSSQSTKGAVSNINKTAQILKTHVEKALSDATHKVEILDDASKNAKDALVTHKKNTEGAADRLEGILG